MTQEKHERIFYIFPYTGKYACLPKEASKEEKERFLAYEGSFSVLAEEGEFTFFTTDEFARKYLGEKASPKKKEKTKYVIYDEKYKKVLYIGEYWEKAWTIFWERNQKDDYIYSFYACKERFTKAYENKGNSFFIEEILEENRGAKREIGEEL